MPGFNQHCADCERQLGETFPEVHRWLDAFAGSEGDWAHRAFRHHREGIEQVRSMWGDRAARAAILHILLDWDGIREDEIPRDREEAEQFGIRWLSALPRLEDLGDEA